MKWFNPYYSVTGGYLIENSSIMREHLLSIVDTELKTSRLLPNL